MAKFELHACKSSQRQQFVLADCAPIRIDQDLYSLYQDLYCACLSRSLSGFISDSRKNIFWRPDIGAPPKKAIRIEPQRSWDAYNDRFENFNEAQNRLKQWMPQRMCDPFKVLNVLEIFLGIFKLQKSSWWLLRNIPALLRQILLQAQLFLEEIPKKS